MAEEDKVTRWPSNAELDLQRRLDEEKQQAGEAPSTGRDVAVEGNDTSDYVGVSPEYMTYANETEKPLRADGGPEEVLEDRVLERVAGAVASTERREGKSTQGGGSVTPTLYAATSGDSVQPEKVGARSGSGSHTAAKKATPPRPPASE